MQSLICLSVCLPWKEFSPYFSCHFQVTNTLKMEYVEAQEKGPKKSSCHHPPNNLVMALQCILWFLEEIALGSRCPAQLRQPCWATAGSRSRKLSECQPRHRQKCRGGGIFLIKSGAHKQWSTSTSWSINPGKLCEMRTVQMDAGVFHSGWFRLPEAFDFRTLNSSHKDTYLTLLGWHGTLALWITANTTPRCRRKGKVIAL